MEFGIRLNNKQYFSFYLDLSNGDITVRGEIIMDDGTVVNPTGYVVWEDGE